MTHPFITRCLRTLEATPRLLQAWSINLPEEVLGQNEGEATWSIYEVMAHMVHNERTDWLPRIHILMSADGTRTFEPFDRHGGLDQAGPATLSSMLTEFEELRYSSLKQIGQMELTAEDLERTAIHPHLGPVTLRQLFSAYVVHDQTHIYQIARCISYPLRHEVGPWSAYLRIIAQDH